MAERKCISRICLVGFGEDVKPVIEEENEKESENNEDSEAK